MQWKHAVKGERNLDTLAFCVVFASYLATARQRDVSPQERSTGAAAAMHTCKGAASKVQSPLLGFTRRQDRKLPDQTSTGGKYLIFIASFPDRQWSRLHGPLGSSAELKSVSRLRGYQSRRPTADGDAAPRCRRKNCGERAAACRSALCYTLTYTHRGCVRQVLKEHPQVVSLRWSSIS